MATGLPPIARARSDGRAVPFIESAAVCGEPVDDEDVDDDHSFQAIPSFSTSCTSAATLATVLTAIDAVRDNRGPANDGGSASDWSSDDSGASDSSTHQRHFMLLVRRGLLLLRVKR
jgi:hypothetical protein